MAWSSICFCVVLPSFESDGQGDEEGSHEEGGGASCASCEACQEGHEKGNEGSHERGGGASCASCEACQEGHEKANEGSHEESDEEEGLSKLSRTPLEGPSAFQSSGVALSDMSGQVGIHSKVYV